MQEKQTIVSYEGREYTATYQAGDTMILETFEPWGGEMVILRPEREAVRYYKGLKQQETSQNSGPELAVKTLKRSGRDELGRQVLQGSVTMERVGKMMNQTWENGYLSLGFHTSARCFTVDPEGAVWMQPEFSLEKRKVYAPEEGGPLGQLRPNQSFFNGYIPILCNVHSGLGQCMETLYLTEHGDSNFEYALWIRRVIYQKESGQIKSIAYENVGVCGLGNRLKLNGDIFADCLMGLLDYWLEFEQEQTKLSLPEKELELTFRGTMMTLDNLRSGFALRYGNEFYSLESHNNFPPNYICMIWTYAMTGHLQIARGILEHFLSNVVDTKGRIIYRQGQRQLYGFSGSEIGQLLWLIQRYAPMMGDKRWLIDQWKILERLGRRLIGAVAPCIAVKGARLVHMCAEADTNGRIYDYLQNSLWAIRGLEALGELGRRCGQAVDDFEETAVQLRKSIKLVCKTTAVDTPFGKAVPFQLDYTALPLTLSKCRDTAYPVDEAEQKSYLGGSTDPRGDLEGRQNLLENNYAGYRYYLEMLSSCLLEEDFEKTIVAMRENLGGQWLGMTRFMDGLDDWPVYNYAVYLMERGEIQRFLLLFYAHILYHGNRKFHLYYEQVECREKGMRKIADSCVPCCALPVMMTSMMFCYETVDASCVQLLKGIPDHWRCGCSIGPVYLSGGTIRLTVTKTEIQAQIEGQFKQIWLYLGSKDPKQYQGREGVLRCGENYLVMRPHSFRLIL